MSERTFEMEVSLLHEFGGWHLYVDGRRQPVSARQALRLARTVAKIDRPGTERVTDYVGAVLAQIRADADEAEAQAVREANRAGEQVESSARSAHRARIQALQRRAEADELAPAPVAD